MPVDDQRQVRAALGRDATHMPRDRSWHIEALPAHHLAAPSEVGIFAEGEELLIEKLAFHRNALDEGATEHCGRAACPKHVLHPVVLAYVALLGAAVEVTHVAREVDSSGIDDVGLRLLG